MMTDEDLIMFPQTRFLNLTDMFLSAGSDPGGGASYLCRFSPAAAVDSSQTPDLLPELMSFCPLREETLVS